MIKLYELFPCRNYLEQWVKDEQFDRLNRFGLFANLRYHYTQHHEIAESEDLRRILNFSKMATSAFWNIWISHNLLQSLNPTGKYREVPLLAMIVSNP